jgi:hypothetical protein
VKPNFKTMALAKIILYPGKKKPDGTISLALRLTHNKKLTYFILEKIQESDWDSNRERVKDTHPNSHSINRMLKSKLALANELILELKKGKTNLTHEEIVKKLRNDNTTQTN